VAQSYMYASNLKHTSMSKQENMAFNLAVLRHQHSLN